MTLQKDDIKLLEEMVRRVVREEIHSILHGTESENEFVDDAAFEAAADKIFKKHKTVLDALS